MITLKKETKEFTIKDLLFKGEFNPRTRDKTKITPEQAQKEINEVGEYIIKHYRDGGTFKVITSHATYVFEIAKYSYVKGFGYKREYKPYVRKLETIKEGE